MSGSDTPLIDILEGAVPPKPKGPAVAVALHYDKESGEAPIITASGRGVIAEQILALAFKHGVKVREDADLVSVLAQFEVDSPIPLEAFAAVAEILAYVYRANRRHVERAGA